jgi:septum formation protein
MDKAFEFLSFKNWTHDNVDLLVSEIPTVLSWLGYDVSRENDSKLIRETIIPELRKIAPVVILHTSKYSHEYIATPNEVTGPTELDYNRCTLQERIGYADKQTTRWLYRFMSPRILLASKSPRRLALLSQIVEGNKIEVMDSNEPEEYIPNEDPIMRVTRLAKVKAHSAARKNFSKSIQLIIGADTEIVVDNEVIENPGSDEEKARAILYRLSGRVHEAMTGLVVLKIADGKIIDEKQTCVSTRVQFKQLSSNEIEDYIASKEPFGKAGAYGIQGKGALFIEAIDGSYSNVVGLPLENLIDLMAKDLNMTIWSANKVSNWSLK